MFRLTGPQSLEQGDSAEFWAGVTDNSKFTGISHLRRAVGLRRVADGASQTYLVGEKFLAPMHYYDGGSIGDDETLLSGFANDNHRFAASRPEGSLGDGVGSILFYPPHRDTDTELTPAGHVRFGSSHPGGFEALMCDGSVRSIAFNIDPVTHYLRAHRADAGGLVR